MNIVKILPFVKSNKSGQVGLLTWNYSVLNSLKYGWAKVSNGLGLSLGG